MRGTLSCFSGPLRDTPLSIARQPVVLPRRDEKPVTWSREREASPSLRRGVLLASGWLTSRQTDQGHWCGRCEGNAGDAARLLLTLIALDLVEGDRAEQLADQLVESQLPDGGWSTAPGGDADLSVSVLAYAAIKRLRGPAALGSLRAARRAILARGGAGRVSDEANAWLALFGETPLRDHVGHSDVMSAVERGAGRSLDALHSVSELFGAADTGDANTCDADAASIGLSPLAGLLSKRLALGTDGPSEAIAQVEQAIEELVDDQDDALMVAPQKTPEIDTAQAIEALVEAGRRADAGGAAAWLVERIDALCDGDDVFAAAIVLRVLAHWSADAEGSDALPPRLRVHTDDAATDNTVGDELDDRVAAAIGRLAGWLRQRQLPDGGWGADDVTAITIEALASAASEQDDAVHTTVERAIEQLVERQAPDGGWRSSRSTDGVFAVSRVVLALAAVEQRGWAGGRDAMLAGVNWLLAEQSESGGWGELFDEQGRPRMSAAATPTAWALEALTAADLQHDDACGRAVEFLLQFQSETGEWDEPHFFLRQPNGAACRNDLAPTTAALRSLAAWAARSRRRPAPEPEVCLRVVSRDTVAS